MADKFLKKIVNNIIINNPQRQLDAFYMAMADTVYDAFNNKSLDKIS